MRRHGSILASHTRQTNKIIARRPFRRAIRRLRSIRGIRLARIDINLPTQFLHNSFQFLQALDQLSFSLAEVLLGSIRVAGPRLARLAPRRGEYAWDEGPATSCAWHLLVALDLAPATCHARARIHGRVAGAI